MIAKDPRLDDAMLRKIVILCFVFALALIIIISRLFYLQVLQGESLAKLGERNFLRTEIIDSPRGNVRDCQGRLLATNRPVFDLYWEGLGARRLSDEHEKVVATLHALLERESIDAFRAKIGRAERYGKRVKIASDLPFDLLCQVREQCSLSANLIIAQGYQRSYPHQTLASHVLGYLGRGSDVLAEESLTGRSGLEKLFHDALRGQRGYVQHVINSVGKKLEKRSFQAAVAGDDITLTIDSELQQLLEESFGQEFAGCAILMEAKTGAVRALHSYPNFDPNLFLQPISHDEWHEKFSENSPFLNRPVSALYPPASIFKLVTFAAGLEEGIIFPDSVFDCKGFTRFGGRKYYCQRRWGHGELSSHAALAYSCNIPCYDIGRQIHIDTLAHYAYRFGLGMKTGFLFAEHAGLVPTSAWKSAIKGELWWPGETISCSIGQSYFLVTPLQIARLIAAIATGYLVKPRILMHEEVETQPLLIAESTLSFLRASMMETVQIGTALYLRGLDDMTIAAKTGTAQTSSLQLAQIKETQREHGWFTSFFSYKEEDPLVLVVLTERTGRSTPAIRIAQRMLKGYRQLRRGQQA